MHGYGFMWPMGGMMVGWLVLTALVAAVVVWLVVTSSHARGGSEDMGAARRILAERYARGELDTDEYTHRLRMLP